VIASGDGVYKLDYNKVLEYHIEKKADITLVVKNMTDRSEINRFGIVTMTDEGRITDLDEKPLETDLSMVSTGIYVVRRRLLIELIEKAAEEDRHDLVRDILVRYKNIKKLYGYKLDTYWNNISTVDSYFKTNMDFLDNDIRKYFFKEYPDIYSKVDDLPPAKYNYGSNVRNSLISSGGIINGTVEHSVLFKKIYIGNNSVVKNSVILNNAYIGDNSYIENCIVESGSTIKANSRYVGESGVQIVTENNPVYY
jgi:glucose-1-phosphate adenylyltransferase